MIKNLPGGLEKFEKVLREKHQSQEINKNFTENHLPAINSSKNEEAIPKKRHHVFSPMTRMRAQNKKNIISMKGSFGDKGENNSDVKAWKTENRNYGSEEPALIEPHPRQYHLDQRFSNTKNSKEDLKIGVQEFNSAVFKKNELSNSLAAENPLRYRSPQFQRQNLDHTYDENRSVASKIPK